jgi:D-alanyl-D-alanine carboxypeptidase
MGRGGKALIGARRKQQGPGHRLPARLGGGGAPMDDIPEARRVVALRPAGPLWREPLVLSLGGSLLVLAGLALLLQQPLRRWLAPAPVPGLAARLGADGRLLGHFPYAEAAGNQLVAIAPGQQLQRDAAKALLAMQRAARSEGVDLVVLSAFRSIAVQKELFFDGKSERAQSARERAQVSAPPGFSEHSTGYAVDLGDGRSPTTNLAADFADTPAFRWLQTHAARFHFVLSFPEDNPQAVSYEPWHWRFEGTAEALKTFEPAQRLQP